nr:hypothetical protein [Acidimicrobiales bacterium]
MGKPLQLGLAVLAATLVFVLLTRDVLTDDTDAQVGFTLGKPTSHVLNGDPADLEAVAFNPMNATIPDLSFCGDVEFVNSRSWSGPLDPEAYSTDQALIDYFVVAEV